MFQLHGVDATGAVNIARSVRRGALLRFFGKLPRRVVSMEACSPAHHWDRLHAGPGFSVKLNYGD